MYVYHRVNGITGVSIEPLTPKSTPSWVRRPEPVAWSAEFNIIPNPIHRNGVTREGNPNADLQHRITPWRDLIVVSWRGADGAETALAAGIVSGPLVIDEVAGTLTVPTVCVRTLMQDRMIMQKSFYPGTRRATYFNGLTWAGIASEAVRYATSDYLAYPPANIHPVGGFDLPIDRPGATPGSHNMGIWGYSFTTAADVLEDVEEAAGSVVDFRPYWAGPGQFRWSMEVFADTERADTIMDLGNTGAPDAQGSLLRASTDASEAMTYTHVTGKGSEVDILYTRRADFSPTVMTREALINRPDIETHADLHRKVDAINASARRVVKQDELRMRVDADNARWSQPTDLLMGATAQLTVSKSLAYGDATLRRTIIGWSASGDTGIAVEVQDLTEDIEA